MDLVGVALVSLRLLLFVWPLVQGRQAGWPVWAWLALASAVPGVRRLLVVGAPVTGRRLAPLIPVTLFRNRSFTVGLLAAMTTFAAFTPLILVFTLYLQEGLGTGRSRRRGDRTFALARDQGNRVGRPGGTDGPHHAHGGRGGAVRGQPRPRAVGPAARFRWPVAGRCAALFVAGLGLGFIVATDQRHPCRGADR